MVGAESLGTENAGCVVGDGSSERRFAVTSPIWFAGQLVTTSRLQNVWLQLPSFETPPAKWSFSSAVTTNRVLCWLIPSFFSRAKKVANASSYDFSVAT